MSASVCDIERVAANGEENTVQFRLLYSGRLLGASRTDTRAGLKHAIRRELHPQLRRLWETNRNLRQFSSFTALRWRESHPEDAVQVQQAVEESAEKCGFGIRYLAEKWERCGKGFVPLVTEEMGARVSLGVLFLRPEEPGMLVRGGDLDNRLKTLFDALRLPNNLDEAGGKQAENEEGPTYCLLEDDGLISEVRVVTDNLLLLPHETQTTANDVFLVIEVEISVPTHSTWKYWFN